jgi:uncharacterized protein YbdZ (MbtH family)
MSATDPTYRVVADVEDAYMLVPAGQPTATGWRDVGEAGSRDDCLAYIRAIDGETRAPVLRCLLERGRRLP